jgi:tetratricopeptide (TPR) repeat protein
MIKIRCRKLELIGFVLTALCCGGSGCHRQGKASNELVISPPAVVVAGATKEDSSLPGPCDLILVTHAGAGRVDVEIRTLQARLRNETNTFHHLERLGWLFVAKARESFDPGYYKLAQQCAACLESQQAHSPEALLLRGHVLQNLHQFKEAEPLARELVGLRGRSFDYGLLGDVLMEEGSLGEAAEAYQKMVDERPDLHAYARISHLRWLKGDLDGAVVAMRLAVSAASPNSPEEAAWVNTHLALLEFQKGNLETSKRCCATALDYQRDYAPALLLQGRLFLATGSISQAVEVLRRAVQLNPLPDYQWLLSDALRAAGQDGEAAAVEATIHRQGAAADPRTFALYLATRGESLTTALELARHELSTRGDIFTHDALAWALAANGLIEQARLEVGKAVSEGTRDARLYLHAAVIAAKAGENREAQLWLDKAAPMIALMLPSEKALWQPLAAQMGQAEIRVSDAATQLTTIFTPAH